MPVPVSMWQPWLAWTGQGGGARASFFGNPVVEVAGRRVAPLICYEQLLVWPVLQSMLYSPDVVVAIGNDWWTADTSILAIQRASTQAWARLFGLPLVLAFNT
jgi:apolipoprotein N-acyltransferase